MDDSQSSSTVNGRNDRQNLTSRYRLREFDYSTPGYYFLTIPTHDRHDLLGEIVDAEMKFSEFGSTVKALVADTDRRFPSLSVVQFEIIPNHVHLLLHISIDNEITTPSDFVKQLKGTSTAAYRKGVREGRFRDVGPKVWQVGFNDEIIRNDIHLENVRRYMSNNVIQWTEDELYRLK